MAATYTISVDAGSSFERHFHYTDDEGVAMDLTGWTAKMHIRETPEAELALELIPAIDLAEGKISVTMSPAQTGSLTLANYVYQIELANAGTGEVVRILQGKVLISPEVVYA